MHEDIRIVLVDTSHPGNIGAAARAMKNMGLSRLVLVRPQAFPHTDASARAAGAEDVLDGATVADSIESAIGGCGLVLGASARPRNARWRMLDARSAGIEALAAATSKPVAVLFGNERNGLANEDLALCHALVNIPADAGYCSLNLAQAVQIICYEIHMARGGPHAVARTGPPPADAGDLAHLYRHLDAVLVRIGFSEPLNSAQIRVQLERLLARAVPDEREVQILRGMLTAIERSLGPGKAPPP